MDDQIDTKSRTEVRLRPERPKLHKVMLVNDDYTPREFVTRVLQVEFRLGEAKARQIMMAAHQKGVCVVSVYPRDVAETKATNATDLARRQGYPLMFTTEPEE